MIILQPAGQWGETHGISKQAVSGTCKGPSEVARAIWFLCREADWFSIFQPGNCRMKQATKVMNEKNIHREGLKINLSVGTGEEPQCRNTKSKSRDCNRDRKGGSITLKVITDCGIKTNVLRA